MNIAIKLPNELGERVLSFPFLHKLVQVYEQNIAESEDHDEVLYIHLISCKKDIDVLNLLPFRAYYHELEDEDIGNIFSMHRACVNFKLDRPDIYISTTPGFIDSSIGKNINAKKSIGYDVGKNKWVLSEKVSLLEGQHKSVQIFNLLTALSDREESVPHVQSRQLEPFYKDWQENPYTVINLDLLENGEINPEWAEFIELFTEKKFVFLASNYKEEDYEDFLAAFIAKLPDTNQYEIFTSKSNIDFGKLVASAITFITKSCPLMHIAAYCGAHTFYLNCGEDLQVMGPEFLRGDVRVFSQSDPAYFKEDSFNYAKIFDEVFTFIDLRSKVTEKDEE